MSMIALLSSVFALAALALAAGRWAGRALPLLCAAGSGGILWLLVAGHDPTGAPARESVAWLGALGADMALRLDGLSFFFAALVLAVGAAALWYTSGYARAWKEGRALFCGWMLVFMGAMLGLILSDNLLITYVFWELTTVASFLLIGFKREEAEARDAAFVSLIATGAGGLALLGGILLLGAHSGTFVISEIVAKGPIQNARVANAATLLIGAGALIKCAQFPFHFWLPRAMAAPTPASAYLHAAAMVKAGLYLLARLLPALGESSWWSPLLGGVAAASMLVALLGMLSSHDMKAALAYATIGALAVGLALLAVGTPKAMETFALFILAHAGYKACLFMVAGGVEEVTGTRDLRRLCGVARLAPGLAFAGVAGALALAEFGPELSYIAKELALEVFRNNAGWAGAGLFAALATGFVALSVILGYKVFFGRGEALEKERGEGISLWAPAALLGLSSLGFALAPEWTQHWLATPLVDATAPSSEPLEKLALWHGWNWKVATSLATVAAGVALALAWPRLNPLLARANSWALEGTERLSRTFAVSVARAGGRQQGWIEHGRLPLYALAAALAVAVATLPWAGESFVALFQGWRAEEELWFDAALAALGVLGVIGAATANGRWTMVASLGLAGLAVTVVYARYGAPDVALANALVETLMVVLLVGAVRALPDLRQLTRGWVVAAKAAVATLCGAAVTLAIVGSKASGAKSQVSDFYLQTTQDKDLGNVVATILVDFRALDTFGETTVLAVAAIGVFHLARSAKRGNGGAP